MFWSQIFAHFFLFALLLYLTRPKVFPQVEAEDRLILLFHILFFIFTDILQALPYLTTLDILKEDSVNDTFHVFCYFIACSIFAWTGIRSGTMGRKIAFLCAGLTLLWFCFEELNYGVIGFHLPVLGPIHRAFLEVRSIDDLSNISPLGMVLKSVWTILVLALMVTFVLLSVSPRLSLKTYRRIRWMQSEFKTHYLGKNGLLYLLNRGMLLGYFLFARTHLWEGIIPYDSEIEQTALSLIVLLYSVLFIYQKEKCIEPIYLNRRPMRFLFPLTVAWMAVWISVQAWTSAMAVPVRSTSAMVRKDCAESLRFHHLAAYKVGSRLVVRGIIDNNAEEDVDKVAIDYSFADPSGKAVFKTQRLMFPIDDEAPAKSGYGQTFKSDFYGLPPVSSVEISLYSCRKHTKTSRLLGLGK